MRHYDIKPFWGAVVSIAVLAATIVLLEKWIFRKQHRRSSGVDFTSPGHLDIVRVLVKLLGLYFTIALVALFYWLLPEYNGGLYRQYFKLALDVLPIILLGSIPYFLILDKYMKDPYDGHWHVGMLILGKWNRINRKILKNHFLGWVVKAFFLPLMFSALINNTGILFRYSFHDSLVQFPKFYDYMYNFIFSVDLVFVSAGYLLTLKVFDSHMRSVEPSIFGWIVALQCYQPFWSFSYQHYLNYDDNLFWGHVITSSKFLYSSYGMIILLLFTIYSLASVAFGLRFSNLTNRGIITNGPYRWMKHPAYIAKNLAWWMISVPFLSNESWEKAVQHSLLLLTLNFIYYLRAVTEERHLSLDPTYVQYATALNDKGLFRGLYRIFPYLKYDVNRYIENGKIKKLFF
jgi:isoprenylcysteine carboxyl methyltransferase (ICMT) family protein YpbQ